MAGSWRDTSVAEIAASSANALVGGPFGSNLVSRDYVASGVPVIRGQNMAGRWVSGEFAFVTKEKAESLASNLARPGDIVFTQRGTLGQVSLVPSAPYDHYLISQSQMKLTVDRDLANPLFCYYLFRSPRQQEYIRQNATQSGVPHTNLGTLRGTPVSIPTLVEQQSIAEVLGSLDDKIELNRRMNRALEGMARAIFKAWFVDFEPVKAKAAGATSFPGMPQDVFDQLPDTFDDADRGQIPSGWSVDTLGRVMEHPRRSVKPAEIDPDTPYIGLEHMPQKSIALPEWGDVGSVSSNKYRCERGEILFGKLRPYFHKVGIAPIDGVCSTDVVVLRPVEPEWTAFVVGHVSSDAFVAYTTAASTGTKMPRTNWKDMSSYKVCIPSPSFAAVFDQCVGPMYAKLLRNICESRVLASLRDTLLPKLISGELRVPDVESAIEEVA